jgi:hypothetical protein
MNKKCTCPKALTGPIINGEPFTMDPCVYVTTEVLSNCIVEISKCKFCGNINISWHRTEDTQAIPKTDWEALEI